MSSKLGAPASHFASSSECLISTSDFIFSNPKSRSFLSSPGLPLLQPSLISGMTVPLVWVLRPKPMASLSLLQLASFPVADPAQGDLQNTSRIGPLLTDSLPPTLASATLLLLLDQLGGPHVASSSCDPARGFLLTPSEHATSLLQTPQLLTVLTW